MDGRVWEGVRQSAEEGRLRLPQYRRQGQRRVQVVPRGTECQGGRAGSPEYHPLGKVDSGARVRDQHGALQAGQQRPLCQQLPRVHLPHDEDGVRKGQQEGRRGPVRGQDQHRKVVPLWRRRLEVQGQPVVHTVRDRRVRKGAPGGVPPEAARDVHKAGRRGGREGRLGPVRG